MILIIGKKDSNFEKMAELSNGNNNDNVPVLIWVRVLRLLSWFKIIDLK